MQDFSYLTPEEKSFVDWMRRPATMNKRTAENLIDELEESIAHNRQQIQTAANRVEKNLYYTRIEGRRNQIKWASQFIDNPNKKIV